MSHWKPEGYNSASPYLIVADAKATAEFLVTVFGGEKLRNYAKPDGTIMHCEIRVDDTVLMLCDPVENWPAIGAHVHIYVADVDATHRRAIAAGAQSVMTPAKKDDADKRGGFKDHGGTTWWIATQIE